VSLKHKTELQTCTVAWRYKVALSTAPSSRSDALLSLPLPQPQSLASVAAETDDDAAIVTPVTRTYYIQAEQELWNYFPSGLDRCKKVYNHPSTPCQTPAMACTDVSLRRGVLLRLPALLSL